MYQHFCKRTKHIWSFFWRFYYISAYASVSMPTTPQSSLNKSATGCDSLRCLKDTHHGKGLWRRKGRPYRCHLWRGSSNLTPEDPCVRERWEIPWLAFETSKQSSLFHLISANEHYQQTGKRVCPAAGKQLASGDPLSRKSCLQKVPGCTLFHLHLHPRKVIWGCVHWNVWYHLRTRQLVITFGHLERWNFWEVMVTEVDGVN